MTKHIYTLILPLLSSTIFMHGMDGIEGQFNRILQAPILCTANKPIITLRHNAAIGYANQNLINAFNARFTTDIEPQSPFVPVSLTHPDYEEMAEQQIARETTLIDDLHDSYPPTTDEEMITRAMILKLFTARKELISQSAQRETAALALIPSIMPIQCLHDGPNTFTINNGQKISLLFNEKQELETNLLENFKQQPTIFSPLTCSTYVMLTALQKQLEEGFYVHQNTINFVCDTIEKEADTTEANLEMKQIIRNIEPATDQNTAGVAPRIVPVKGENIVQKYGCQHGPKGYYPEMFLMENLQDQKPINFLRDRELGRK